MRYSINEGYWLGVTNDSNGKRVWLHFDWEHQWPDWMPFKLHRLNEHVLMYLKPIMFRNTILEALYHLLSGLTCGYTLKEVAWFIRLAS